MYLTLAVVRFTATGEVKYISAGHLPLLHYQQRTASVIRHSMSQFPLGLFAGVQYVSEIVSFEPGDVFALVTDGVAEMGDNPDAERGLERVSDLLGRLHDRPLPDVATAMLTEATTTGNQHDDATVLLRCSGEPGTRHPDAAEVSPTREAIWSRHLDALEELLAREDKLTNKNETDQS
jgi:serine phosphatase RsbU (regulator of sigma subunit)